jgi:ribonucleoside-triphosphate reductase (formate)
MRDSYLTPARDFAPGMGEAVAQRTVARELSSGVRERWSDVAKRVSIGNALLHPASFEQEFHAMNHHLRQASLLMSGRHLQHGDDTQPTRNMEVFTNCSTSASTFLLFYLLLNGSGVGRAYDDEMMLVDYNFMPIVIPCIDWHHKDVQTGEITFQTAHDMRHLYAGMKIVEFRVPDSREGWAQAMEKIEVMTFRKERNTVLLLDFSDVRPKGSPIKGMQDRPASGPGPLMKAIANVSRLRDAGMEPWRAAMYADHYSAECVLVGGARRAARMATKWWRDATIFEFIKVKQGGFLWSSNNSVTVDQYFWDCVLVARERGLDWVKKHLPSQLAAIEHAIKVFDAVCWHSYHDGTGEPGFINVDKLSWRDDGLEALLDGKYAESKKFKLMDETLQLTSALAKAFAQSEQKAITNPCGEIVLGKLGGYCVIADVVPFHAGPEISSCMLPEHEQAWDDDAEDAFRTATRALIRTNLMDSLYSKEVKRTNRIGVGITGLHEYAWSRFGYGFKDLINERKSRDFWMTLSRFKRAVDSEAYHYSQELGVEPPHTTTTIKPAGTTSKLFGLTEGAHLPSMREYLRWVQFRNDDPLIKEYQAKGYPVRKLVTYSGTTIVGFPTAPMICTLGMGEKLVTAGEATPEEQYQYLKLLEKYWIAGVNESGMPLDTGTGNQVSYTLKYDPKVVDFEHFKATLFEGQSRIRCCSVMPQSDTSAYEYQPEEPVTKAQYELILKGINDETHQEDVDFAHVDCAGGACPVDFNAK